MPNLIFQNEKRKADTDYVAEKFGIDRRDPAMREAAEITAARCREAVESAKNVRRYY